MPAGGVAEFVAGDFIDEVFFDVILFKTKQDKVAVVGEGAEVVFWNEKIGEIWSDNNIYIIREIELGGRVLLGAFDTTVDFIAVRCGEDFLSIGEMEIDLHLIKL